LANAAARASAVVLPAMRQFTLVLTLASGLTAAGAAPVSDLQPDLLKLVSSQLRLSPRDIEDLEAGRVVTRGLPGGAPGEVAAVGAVRINARRAVFLARFRDIENFKRGPEILEIGRFSSPPISSDLGPLTLTHEDVDLHDCRVADCDIRLPAQIIARFQHEIDWKGRDADARAAALFKEVLLDHVRAYVSGEPGRMTEYDDDKRVVRPVEDFAGLMNNSPYVGSLVPGLSDHLLHYPGRPLLGAEDFLYWSKEKFGLTPFVTVTQVTIAPPDTTRSVIASKDIYSSRYFDASLTLTVASDAVRTPSAFYLVYVNRSRASALKGAFAGLRRAIVERRARSSLEEQLRTLRLRLERAM
jgi:hypothetical protein